MERAVPVNTSAASFTRLDISNSATQFSWLVAENYQAKCGMDQRGRVGPKKKNRKQTSRQGMFLSDTLDWASRVEMKG